jgi:hypothetical protein
VFQNLNILRFKTQKSHPLTTWTWCGKNMFDMEGTYNWDWVCTNLRMSKRWTKPWNSPMEWNIYKWVPSQENVKMSRIQNHFSHIWYDVLLFIFIIWNFFFNLILYQTLGPKLISHFVGMHVGMGRNIIMEIQITIDPLNGVVQLNFRLGNCTHDLRWQR